MFPFAVWAEPLKVIKGVKAHPVLFGEANTGDVKPLLFLQAVLAVAGDDILAVSLVIANALNEVLAAIVVTWHKITCLQSTDVSDNLLTALRMCTPFTGL